MGRNAHCFKKAFNIGWFLACLFKAVLGDGAPIRVALFKGCLKGKYGNRMGPFWEQYHSLGYHAASWKDEQYSMGLACQQPSQ